MCGISPCRTAKKDDLFWMKFFDNLSSNVGNLLFERLFDHIFSVAPSQKHRNIRIGVDQDWCITNRSRKKITDRARLRQC